MHAMLLNEKSDDFVISTGHSHSVRDFLKATLEVAGLKGDIEEYVEIDPALQRPADSSTLVGDNSKAKRVLGWNPETSFEKLVELMFQHEMNSSL